METLRHYARSCRCEQRGLWRSRIEASSVPPLRPLRPQLPLHKSVSRKPAVGLRRGEEVIFYIRAVNHSSMLCVFPMVVWLPDWLSGWQEEGMCCWVGPSTEGLAGRLGQGVAGLLHGLGGAYLNQSPVWAVALLLYCSCIRPKTER